MILKKKKKQNVITNYSQAQKEARANEIKDFLDLRNKVVKPDSFEKTTVKKEIKNSLFNRLFRNKTLRKQINQQLSFIENETEILDKAQEYVENTESKQLQVLAGDEQDAAFNDFFNLTHLYLPPAFTQIGFFSKSIFHQLYGNKNLTDRTYEIPLIVKKESQDVEIILNETEQTELETTTKRLSMQNSILANLKSLYENKETLQITD